MNRVKSMFNKSMYHRIGITLFTFAVLLPLLCIGQAVADDVILLGKPATDWQKEAFPLGNGRLGCKVTPLSPHESPFDHLTQKANS